MCALFYTMPNTLLWDLPGDVLAAPESASGLDRCNLSLSLSLIIWDLPEDVLAAPASALCGGKRVSACVCVSVCVCVCVSICGAEMLTPGM